VLGELAIHATAWTSYVGAIAAAVAAVGTVAAVMVALFYQPLREKRAKPALRLDPPADSSFGLPADFDTLTTVTLRVVADRGRKSAEAVEVLVTAMWRAGSPDAYLHTQFDSQPLPWYRSDEVDGDLARIHMAPGTSRQVEILKVGSPIGLYEWLNWPKNGFQNETAAFTVPPKPRWPGSSPLVQAYLDWRIRFFLTAKDVDSIVYEADLKLEVEWHEKEGQAKRSAPENWKQASSLRVNTRIRWENFRKLDQDEVEADDRT
jgi:hypothetical protein